MTNLEARGCPVSIYAIGRAVQQTGHCRHRARSMMEVPIDSGLLKELVAQMLVVRDDAVGSQGCAKRQLKV